MSLLVVGSAPSLEGAAGDLVREILSEARVEFAIVTDSERLESALKPGAALLVGQAGVELFRAAGAIYEGVPTASIACPLVVLRSGHPTPVSRAKVKRMISAVRRLAKKMAKPRRDCAHERLTEVGEWIPVNAGKRARVESMRVCEACGGLV